MSENLKPRQSAVRILSRVLSDGESLDLAIDSEKDYATYSDSDRHFIKLLTLTTLRRLGQIDSVLSRALKKPLPTKQQVILQILRLSLAQALFLQTPAYAVVHTAVALTRRFHREGLTGLVNGVLRSVLRQKEPLSGSDLADINIPAWLFNSWKTAYSADVAHQIAESVLTPPALDISVLKDADFWANRWNGKLLPTGSIRVPATNPTELEGFNEIGWVQNAAATVPAQLLTNVAGKRIADLCAAPGGKTLQLAARGAFVTAIDISESRLSRLFENIRRLGLESQVRIKVCDALTFAEDEPFDAVLLDAPCSATGTLARHPEIKYHRTPDDICRLSDLQKQLLHHALDLTKSGGDIVFSTCSLQPEEGDSVITDILPDARVTAPSQPWLQPYRTSFGSLRFFPLDGYDGFYVCLLKKT